MSRAQEGLEITRPPGTARPRRAITRQPHRVTAPRLRPTTVRPPHRITARLRPTTARHRFVAAVAVVEHRVAAVAVVGHPVAAVVDTAVAATAAGNDLPSAAPADLTGPERHFFIQNAWDSRNRLVG